MEIGLTDQYLKDLSEAHDAGKGDDLPYFIPWDLYSQARVWAAQIAKEAGNNTRCTLVMTELVYHKSCSHLSIDHVDV